MLDVDVRNVRICSAFFPIARVPTLGPSIFRDGKTDDPQVHSRLTLLSASCRRTDYTRGSAITSNHRRSSRGRAERLDVQAGWGNQNHQARSPLLDRRERGLCRSGCCWTERRSLPRPAGPSKKTTSAKGDEQLQPASPFPAGFSSHNRNFNFAWGRLAHRSRPLSDMLGSLSPSAGIGFSPGIHPLPSGH